MTTAAGAVNLSDSGKIRRVSMLLREAHAHAAAFLAELPQPVHDTLEHVTVAVLATTPPHIRTDAKGLFVGVPQSATAEEEEADDDGGCGPVYDVDAAGELVEAEGSPAQARGQILLFAANLASPEDLERTVCHEIGHALGLDEWDVAELGL